MNDVFANQLTGLEYITLNVYYKISTSGGGGVGAVPVTPCKTVIPSEKTLLSSMSPEFLSNGRMSFVPLGGEGSVKTSAKSRTYKIPEIYSTERNQDTENPLLFSRHNNRHKVLVKYFLKIPQILSKSS